MRPIESVEELGLAFQLVRTLRTHLSLEQIESLYVTAHRENGYRMLGEFEGDQLVGVMGYRILYDFVHGKHLYIDDLIIDEKYRSRGIGAKCLKFAEGLAKAEQCEGLRLCTGVANTQAIKFYEREGWEPRAFAFKKKVSKGAE